MVERTAFNRMVVGSSPTVGTSAEVPERSKGVDLRSTATASWVRIPPSAQKTKYTNSRFQKYTENGSLSSVVERCAYDAVVMGSIPIESTI